MWLISWTLLSAGQFRQRVDLVTVDAMVANARGDAVTDLSASDFEVVVDGKPRRVVAFRRVAGKTDPMGARAGEGATSSPERVVVLVVHRDHIRPHEGRAFFEAGAAFIDTLEPSDRVALWTIPAASPELWMPRDRDELKAGLRAMRGTAPPPHPLINITSDEAVSIVYFHDEATLAEATIRECSRHANAGPVCGQEVELEARRRYHEIRVRAVDALTQLEHLVRLVSSFEGPKHLVFITTGPPQTPDNAEALQRVAAAAALARVHVHAVQVPHLNETIGAESRGRPAPGVRQSNSAGYSLAAMTGGLALTPSDPRVALRRLAAELEGAYELGIEVEPGDRDGKRHRIEVRVISRRGLAIRARQQFVLPPPVPTSPTAPVPSAPLPEVSEVSAAAAGDPVPGALLARLGGYVTRFEREFSSAVAEERYVQLIRPVRGAPSWPSDEQALEWHEGNDYPRTAPIARRRQLLSDVLLVHTPQGWLGYRDVAEVDGGTVRRRSERVSSLFLSRDANRNDQLRRIAEESARYNIGDFRRTLNIPTLPLSFMHPRHHARFTFTSAGRESLDGVTTDVIRYDEHQRPTLIGTRAGDDVPISGRIWIDSVSGAVVQTEIRTLSGERFGTRRGTLVTRYRRDPRFEVLVPDYLWEWYDGGVANVFGSVVTRTIVEGLARYTNYRKFTVLTGEQIR